MSGIRLARAAPVLPPKTEQGSLASGLTQEHGESALVQGNFCSILYLLEDTEAIEREFRDDFRVVHCIQVSRST